jgi:pheromone shutdown protein TraB
VLEEMIVLIGVGHVFSIKDAIRFIILTKKPKAVCIELDKVRFDALEKGNLHNPDAPFFIKRLQKVYEKAAAIQGASVGEEMLSAVEVARDLDIPYFLIDVEASPIIMSILDSLTMAQKIKLAGQVLTASVLPKNYIEEEIKKVQENPEDAMAIFEKEFPTLKRDIVDQRDSYMAQKIRELSGKFSDIVAIIGEGHLPGMIKNLSDMELDIIHLSEVIRIAKDIQNGELVMPPMVDEKVIDAHTVSFTYTIDLDGDSY